MLSDAIGGSSQVLLRAGGGVALNWDFLIMSDGYVYPYFAKGWSLGSQGAGLSLEVGPVDDVSNPSDYEDGFLAVTGSLQAGIPNVFGVGVSGTAFMSAPGMFSGAWGYSIGRAASTSSGFSYLTTLTNYRRIRDANGNPTRFPISDVPVLRSLLNGSLEPADYELFVTQNRWTLLSAFADFFNTLS
jgi:hypothetical protein